MRQSGQWRVGFAGPTGLDYGLTIMLMDRMRLDDEDFNALLDAIQIMEMAALSEMQRKKDGS